MAKFKGFGRLENVIRFSEAFSPDGQVVTISFENLQVSVDGKNPTSRLHSPAEVATQVASFTFPTIENATDLHVHLIIRGFVQTQPGTRAILVAHLGDTTALAPLPASEDFQQELEATLPAGVDVQTTLFLLAERNSGAENLAALLTVDSLDINLSAIF